MADFYVYYFSIENSVRKLITDVLMENYGEDWWKQKVPAGVNKNVEEKQLQEKETAMSILSVGQIVKFTQTLLSYSTSIGNTERYLDMRGPTSVQSKRAVNDPSKKNPRIRDVFMPCACEHISRIGRTLTSSSSHIIQRDLTTARGRVIHSA